MRTIETRIRIDAPADTVWATLADFPSHGEWNPFMQSIEGVPALGERLLVAIALPGKRAMKLRPRITAFETGRRLEWLGSLGVRGVFDGRHSFELVPERDGVTTLVHAESFSGVLVPVLWRSLRDSTLEGFEQFNRAFAERCHRAATAAL